MAGIPKLEDCRPGLSPFGFNLLVAMEPIQKSSPGGIQLPDSVIEKQRIVQVRGRLIAVSPVAFDFASFPAETKPRIGDAVMIAKLSGILTEGADGNEYRIISDKDLVCTIDEGAFA